jgi:uncharacterized cupin superfamily protein
MSLNESVYLTDRADSTGYESMVVEGVGIGEAHWLRTEGSHGNAHEACLWRTDAPASYEYLFTGDESFLVLEGSVSIELTDTGERVELKAGDIASFDAGTKSVWTFTEPFKKFTVISE